MRAKVAANAILSRIRVTLLFPTGLNSLLYVYVKKETSILILV